MARRMSRTTTATTANGTSRNSPTSSSVGVIALRWPIQLGHSAQPSRDQRTSASAGAAESRRIFITARP
jgi:hypothetical protein